MRSLGGLQEFDGEGDRDCDAESVRSVAGSVFGERDVGTSTTRDSLLARPGAAGRIGSGFFRRRGVRTETFDLLGVGGQFE